MTQIQFLHLIFVTLIHFYVEDLRTDMCLILLMNNLL